MATFTALARLICWACIPILSALGYHILSYIFDKYGHLPPLPQPISGSPSEQIDSVLADLPPGDLHEGDGCIICHDTLVRPVEIKQCKHIFCDGCIRAALARDDSCPICRLNLFTADQVSAREPALEGRSPLLDEWLWFSAAHGLLSHALSSSIIRCICSGLASTHPLKLTMEVLQRLELGLSMVAVAMYVDIIACFCVRRFSAPVSCALLAYLGGVIRALQNKHKRKAELMGKCS